MRDKIYTKRCRIGYQESNDLLRVTIPDTINFPAQCPWVYMKDKNTVVLSGPRPPHITDTVQVQLGRNHNLPGCRQLNFGPVKAIGDYFGITPVRYCAIGEELHLTLPSYEERIPLQRRGRAKPTVFKLHQEEESEKPQADILISIPGAEDKVFSMPINEALDLLIKYGKDA